MKVGGACLGGFLTRVNLNEGGEEFNGEGEGFNRMERKGHREELIANRR